VTRWQAEADAAAVADVACRLIGVAARSAIAERGRFNLVLAGGATPLETYRRLAASDQKWKRWSLYYGDERCLPQGDPNLNSSLVRATGLVERVGAHYPIEAWRGAKTAAAEYRERVAGARPFDLVLLGMGEDGHTASLFPGDKWPRRPVFAVRDAPKPPRERVTLAIEVLQDCRSMLVMVTGEGKRDAVRRWRAGEDLPVARVADGEQTLVVVERSLIEFAGDQAAAGPETLHLQ
jgi:6-phosphogluconolactonase